MYTQNLARPSNRIYPFTVLVERALSAVGKAIMQRVRQDPVWILGAGNCFNPYWIVRPIRRQTPQLQSILDRLQIAPAFTCFQMIALLGHTPHAAGLIFILCLLTTPRVSEMMLQSWLFSEAGHGVSVGVLPAVDERNTLFSVNTMPETSSSHR